MQFSTKFLLAIASSMSLVKAGPTKSEFNVYAVEGSSTGMEQLDALMEGYEVATFDDVESINGNIARYEGYKASNDRCGTMVMYSAILYGGELDAASKELESNTVCYLQDLLSKDDKKSCEGYVGDDDIMQVLNAANKSKCYATPSTLSSCVPGTSYCLECSGSHVPIYSDCRNLADQLFYNNAQAPDTPRNWKTGKCYVSWSAPGNFKLGALYNAANDLTESCAHSGRSGKATNVHLSGTTATECLSDRPNGCH